MCTTTNSTDNSTTITLSPPNEENAGISVHGHCYCGELEYTVTFGAGEGPIFPPCYCHCDSCRRSHAAPLYHVVCVDGATNFTITKGEDLLRKFCKPGAPNGMTRCFCTNCGTKILNEFDPSLPFWPSGTTKPMVFFPDTLDKEYQGKNLPQAFRPTRHNEMGECVLDLGLLKTLERKNDEGEDGKVEEEPAWK